MQSNSKKFELPEAPSWLINELKNLTKRAANIDGAPTTFMAPGNRNNDLTSIAGLLRRQGLGAEAIFEKLKALNTTASEPLGEEELRGIAEGVTRNYIPDIRGKLDDLPVSRIIAQNLSGTCRFVPETGWRVYDGRSWVQDQSGVRAKEHIKIQIEAFVEAIKSGSDPDTAREARKYLSNNKVNAIATLLVSDLSVRTEVDCFDKDTSLLNLRNGTLDLTTLHLRQHNSDDMFTKVANVDFEPDADCPNFKKVLDQSLPEEHAAFLLRYLGYALLGDPQEQVFAILYGAGANGKSTLINAVSHMLGEYAANVEPSTLIKQKSESIRTDIARLKGVHLAVTSELAVGQILDAALVKRLTGGDTITARALYKSEFEYQPKFALVMTTNARPVIDGGDAALARRLLLIPFENVIPDADREADLGRRLETEVSGILNELLKGLKDYQGNGLAVPEGLKAVVAEFVVSSDMVGSFIADETEQSDGVNVRAGEFYNRYSGWCMLNGVRHMSKPQFKQDLEKRGYTSKRLSSGQSWIGLRLRRPGM